MKNFKVQIKRAYQFTVEINGKIDSLISFELYDGSFFTGDLCTVGTIDKIDGEGDILTVHFQKQKWIDDLMEKQNAS